MSKGYSVQLNIHHPVTNLIPDKVESDEFTFEDTRVIRSLLSNPKLTETERLALRRLYRTYQNSL